VAAFFFFMIALGVLHFMPFNMQHRQDGHPLFRVMEAITAYVLPGALIVLAIALWAGHKHIFVWMDPEVVAHDKLIQGKSGFLNKGFIYRVKFILYFWMECIIQLFSPKVFNSSG
jgi:hypothetical protein